MANVRELFSKLLEKAVKFRQFWNKEPDAAHCFDMIELVYLLGGKFWNHNLVIFRRYYCKPYSRHSLQINGRPGSLVLVPASIPYRISVHSRLVEMVRGTVPRSQSFAADLVLPDDYGFRRLSVHRVRHTPPRSIVERDSEFFLPRRNQFEWSAAWLWPTEEFPPIRC